MTFTNVTPSPFILLEHPDDAFLAMERAVMGRIAATRMLVADDVALQYQAASVTSRELSGVGFFSNFAVPDDVPRIVPSSFEVTVDATLRDGPDVGFTLFVRDGRIAFLEGYTFGDTPWPEQARITRWGEPP